jgi:hypothetical protein
MKTVLLYVLAILLYGAAFLVLGDSPRAAVGVTLAGAGGAVTLYAIAFRIGWL